MTPKEMIAEFQCPGCVCGINPDQCGSYKPDVVPIGKQTGHLCSAHVVGTSFMSAQGMMHIALGLPKGFNRPGPRDDRMGTRNQMVIRLWTKDQHPEIWNDCNVPVWALEKDGFLFVRTYMPRNNDTALDVIEGGTLALVPRALDVGKFWDEID